MLIDNAGAVARLEKFRLRMESQPAEDFNIYYSQKQSTKQIFAGSLGPNNHT